MKTTFDMKKRLPYLLLFLTVLLIEIYIALFVHRGFVRFHLGDVLVTFLICSFARLIFLGKGIMIPALVLIFSFLVEFAQFFDIVALLGLEEQKVLSILIGRTFSLVDIICYLFGCVLFVAVEAILNKFSKKQET